VTLLSSNLAAAPVAPRAGMWRSLLRHSGARVGLALAGLLVLLAVLGPLITVDPDVPDYGAKLLPPSADHWLGTDAAGRDLLSRSLSGARQSLGAALLVTALATFVGLAVGVVAGTAGGPLDTALTRVTDVLLGLPGLVLTLAVVGALGPGAAELVLALAATAWAAPARLARAATHGARARPDVLAARMAGAGTARVAVTHVLPAALGQVLVAATLGLGEVVLALAALSFLGLGAQPPTAEWGTMLAGARDTLSVAPWQLLGPCTGIVLTVLAATLVSEGLRDVTAPPASA
jgi:nickel transport system permease protein